MRLSRISALGVALLLAGCNLGDFPGGSSGLPPSPATTDLARDAISAHNAVRAHASPAPTPPLPDMQWSADAESVARAWAEHCVYQHNSGRGNLGENIAANSPGAFKSITDVVGAWASEVSDYDYASNSCAPGKDCGHYTQIVWRDSSVVGCAYARCTQNSPFSQFAVWDFWVCDYSPPGNWIGQHPY
jgi:pathogenesis-related protein 1